MACTFTFNSLVTFVILSVCLCGVCCKSEDNPDADKWKKKSIRDYNDADIERLYDQWEDADEDVLPEDELPEWKREPAKIDVSKLDTNDPENLLKATKKGKTLMMFATVSGNPTKDETEKVTGIWHSSLFNANIETQRYVVSDNRAIFMLKDGAMAWEVKAFLIEQDRCEEVTIDGQSYPGKAASNETKDNKSTRNAQKEKSKSSKKTKNNNKKTEL